MPRVSVIVVTWNSEIFIRDCLKSFCNSASKDFSVCVVDNNSSDKTVDILTQEFPFVHLIKNEENRLLSNALNQGVLAHPSLYYLILNPDVVVTQKTILTLCEKMDKDKTIGIIAPKLLYADGSLQYSARRFPTLMTFLARGFGLTEKRNWLPNFMRVHLMMDNDLSKTCEVDWVLGACMLVRKNVFDSVGLYDEKAFPLYYGDIDMCLRAKQKGWKVVYEPLVSALHHYQRESARGGLLNPLKWSHMISALRFLWKNSF